jgi:WD40 repeat protein/serine/threonine protein kinase
MKNLIGTTIHQYQILVSIRETGSRILYKAYDTKTYKYVAFDVVKIQVQKPQKLFDLLKKQSKKNSELIHSNIAEVLDSGIHEGITYFVYNFQPSYSLRPLFNKKYSWQEVCQELVPITQALTYAHEKGIIHSFLNPFSIVIDKDKNPILFDFAFEQIISEYVISTSPGAWINNWGVEYRSPEQLIGAVPDARSDIYSMGMIIFQWVTGEIAFLGETALSTLGKRLSSGSAEIQFNQKFPPVGQKLVKKCLEVHPANRFKTMNELSILLGRGALDLPVTEIMVDDPMFIVSKKRLPVRLVASLILVFIALVFGLTTVFYKGFPAAEFAQSTQASNPLKPTSTGLAFPTIAPSTIVPPTVKPTQFTVQQSTYPQFQGTPMSFLRTELNVGNLDKMINLGIWGVGNINRLDVSSDGTLIATASSIGVFIYDFETLNVRTQLDTRSWVSVIAFSPDGKLLAIGDRDGLIRLWETETWHETASFSGHGLGVLDLAFSPDGIRLASVAMDDTLILWDVSSGQKITPDAVPVFKVTRVEYALDGSTIITGGDDFKVNIWDAKNLVLKGTITISSKVVDMAIINRTNTLAVGSSDRKVSIIDIDSLAIIGRLEGLQYPLSSVASSPDGQYVAAGDINGGISVWDAKGEIYWTLPIIRENADSGSQLGISNDLVFSPDGGAIISALRDGSLRVINAGTHDEIVSVNSGNLHVVKLAISPNSRYAITQNVGGGLKVWDLGEGKILYELPGELKSGNPFSPDSRSFAIAADPSTVKVVSLSDGSELYTLNKHQRIETIQFINNGAQLVAGNEQSPHVWSLSSGQEIKTSRSFGGDGCTNIDTLEKGLIFYVTKYNIAFQDKTNRPGLCSFIKQEWMDAIYLDEKGARAAYGGSSKLTVINLVIAGDKGLEMPDVLIYRKNIVSVAVNSSGTLLAAALDDDTIEFWDINNQMFLIQLYGHDDRITDLRFTPDGKFLLSTSLDGTIRLWGIPN